MSSSSADIRLKGFTLLELLIGMIVSTIVLGATFSAYHIIAKQACVYQEKTKMNEELSLFHSRLMSDFQNNTPVFLLSPFELRMDEAVYHFQESYTLRKTGEHIDTFFVTINACEGFVNGEPIGDSEVALDQVLLKLKTETRQEEIILKKPVDARSLIENNSTR
ncbi:MAG TPA: prepilin-type N-terminal cleavage/methylation domain-containing protein [Bacteroidia bacterium]|nr:prepilin-type N-terminal cleavage/methylation domain-containing protein [Bacteroidia bacterium]